MSMLDDENVRMFVEESREHLATIENDLLAIEERGAEIDDDAVNRLFRAAHSLKGGAGFLNLGKVKELAHKIENVLDMVRSRELAPNPEIVNILLISFDRLRELINNIDESNNAEIDGCIVPLTGLTMANLPDGRKESVSDLVDIRLPDGRAIMQVTRFDLEHARKGGNYIYLVEYDLIHDVHRIGKTPFDVLKNVMSMGTMLDSRVDVEAVGTLNDETSGKIPFYILFATIIGEDIIGCALEIDQRAVRIIAGNEKETPVHNMPALAVKNEIPAVEAGPEPPDPENPIQPVDRKESPATRDAGSPSAAAASETSLRVNVHLLETLMNLAGELVLGRNQLLQAIVQNEARSINAAGQRINMVTSELQEAIMLTRMQAIGNIFNKFPRVVRDTARNVGKTIDLNIVGKEVEMDKTIIEGLIL
jgi:two-component system, chemotaxis family, sensor kinase CheA